MAYFLRTDGVNDVATTSPLNGGSYIAEKFSFKVKASFPTPAPNGFRQAFTVGTSSIGYGAGLRPDGKFRVLIGNTAISVGSGVTGQVYDFEFSRPISQAESGSFQDVIFYVDGVETARVSQPDRVLTEFLTIGFDDRGAYSQIDVYEVDWQDLSNPLNSHNYNKQTLSGANDTLLPDTVGGNDGTLVNFPTDNSQWIFYSAPSAGVDVDVTEISASALESSSISVSANITASVTEVSTDASESSATTITTTISASITELSSDASESSGATITNNLITLAVTEVANDFSESVSASIAGIVGVAVTELNANASESSAADISANISAAVTEIAADFEDDSSINFVGSFTVEVTETSTDFEEACYIQLPVMRLIPRKTISVSKRSSTIRVNKRNHTIRVR
jgi:hypothetical protein